MIDWLFDSQHNRTWFELWLVNAPLDEWWEIYSAQELRPTAWRLSFVGPPDLVSQNIQVFTVAVPGQPDQAYFQIFLNKDSDYDGVPDGYEVAILKTDPLNPDLDSTREADGDGQPDYPGLGGNGIADGDEDFDGDGLTTSYELALGVDPLVAQPTTDSDSDGLPDWLEEVITYWTGDPSPAPQSDSDGDLLNNITEWQMRIDPSWPDRLLGDYSTLPDDQCVIVHQNLELQSPGFGFAEGQEPNPADAYFDASFANYYGTAAELIVLKDTDGNGNAAPGTDTFKWAVAYQTPPDFVPAEDLPAPNPADGPVEDENLLLQVTLIGGHTIGDGVWQAAKVSEHLNTLSEPTLVHIQHRSFSRMWIKFRSLQLMTTAQPTPAGIILRQRAVLAEIHTQATLLRKTTIVLSQCYPSTQVLAQYGRFAPVAGAFCSVLHLVESTDPLVNAYRQYVFDVKRRCDDNDESASELAYALSSVADVAFPAPINVAFLWPIWWNAFANFDGYGSSCL